VQAERESLCPPGRGLLQGFNDPDPIRHLLEIGFDRGTRHDASQIVKHGVPQRVSSAAYRSIALRLSWTEYGSVTIKVINHRWSSRSYAMGMGL